MMRNTTSPRVGNRNSTRKAAPKYSGRNVTDGAIGHALADIQTDVDSLNVKLKAFKKTYGKAIGW